MSRRKASTADAGTAALQVVAAWQLLVSAMPESAWLVEVASRKVVAANAACMALLGAKVEVGARAENVLTNPEDMAFWLDVAAGHVDVLSSETRVQKADGRSADVLRNIQPVGSPATHLLVSLSDRSAMRRAEDEREQRMAELQATLESTADGILVTDLQGNVRACNRHFTHMWGVPSDLLAPGQSAALRDWMQRSVLEPTTYAQRIAELEARATLEVSDRLQLFTGQVLERTTRPLRQRGHIVGRVFSFRDLSEQLAASHRIEELSLTDGLTGLANRRALGEHIEDRGHLARDGGSGFALLLVDLDRFGQINDSLGYETGDHVLLEAARRIKSCMRKDDMLARVGGDQFALLVDTKDVRAVERTARRIIDTVSAPCEFGGQPFTLTCSVGGAIFPADGKTLAELMSSAEAAVRSVKSHGRAHYRVHERRREDSKRHHMQLDHAMRQALNAGRFRLHYQPQVAVDGVTPLGCEALLRWYDPVWGEVSPARFIPVAEESGLIIALGDWVLQQAVRQAALWRADGLALPVAVNVSALQFQQPGFVARVAAVLAEANLPPHLLELELTESILVHDADEALQRLQALAQLGLRLSIDDFGTGYSSLAYLKRFPIHKLKIDRSFVQGLPGDESDAAIVRAIVQMAKALSMSVIAEGVETEAQRQYLQSIGCDEFQGFLYSPAVDSLSFEHHMRKALAAAAPAPADTTAPGAAAPAAAPGKRMRLVKRG